MWTRSHSKLIKSVNPDEIWNRWADVNSWHEWVPNIEHGRLKKAFQAGSQFILKPKGRAAVTVQLAEVEREKRFTGRTRFFGATMYNTYEMQKDPEGTRLTVTVKVTGPLGFLWRMLVAEKIADNLPLLMRNLAGVVSMPTLKKETPETPNVTNTPAPQMPKRQATSSKLENKTQTELPLPVAKKTRAKASASVLKEGSPIKKDKPKPKNKEAGKVKGSSARKKPEL